MKNKKILILLLIIFIIISIILPITVSAIKAGRVRMPRLLSNEELEEKRKNEKMNMIELAKSEIQNYSKETYNAENNEIDDELINKASKVSEEEKEFKNIICKYYKDDYENLIEQINNNSDKMSLSELYSQDYSKKFFNLIIDIIENKDITDKEKEILKEMLNQQHKFMKKDSDIRLKIEKILSK